MNRADPELPPASSPDAPPEEPGFFAPHILVPFLLCSLIWGSTWLVIKDQIAGGIPPVWSVTYRFIIAASAMFFLTAFRRLPFRIDARGQVVAAILGVLQFTLNFNFVYNAEYYVTSGLVAVLFALLIIPNAVLGRIFLNQKITGSFVAGSIVAIAGVALLFVHEYRAAPGNAEMVAWGVGFTLLGILSASIANVMQAAKALKTYPIIPLLAWAMLWGAALNGLYAFITAGAPVWENDWSYFGGILWLGIAASAVTFPLYFGLIRQIGAAKAAYSSVLVPVTAMTLSTIFEGYIWSTLAIGGAVLAMAGLLIAMQARRKSV